MCPALTVPNMLSPRLAQKETQEPQGHLGHLGHQEKLEKTEKTELTDDEVSAGSPDLTVQTPWTTLGTLAPELLLL